MTYINEDTLEKACLAWFEDIGYKTIFGPDILPESNNPLRFDIRDVILKPNLKNAIYKLNPLLDQPILDEAFDIITKANKTSLIGNNEDIYYKIITGVKVNYNDKDGNETAVLVKIIDFDNADKNEFLAINQFSIQGSVNTRRPDILVFVNGLPLSVLELKNPVDEKTTIKKAYNQVQTYKNDIEDLFNYNVACILSDGANARVGSLTANLERYMPWRTIDGQKEEKFGKFEEEVLIKGFFSKEYFLDYMKYFILFEKNQSNIIKKIAGYHQFHAVRKAVDQTLQAMKRKDGKIGVVWHTQGSGKSISMLCYANKVMKHEEMKNPTIVVITDRNDLDNQLFDVFAVGNPDLMPIQAESCSELKEILKNKPSGGIVFTTIQKFKPEAGQDCYPVLSDRSNIVVISDEAHRSQYGLEAKFSKSGELKYGYAKYMRDALPNACFIGFTGTPIEGVDKDTRAVFGDYIDIYDIQDAIRDGATVPIYYEARQIPIKTKEGSFLTIDDQIEEVTEGMSDEEASKTRWATVEALVDTPERLQTIAKDIVEHFENRCSSMDGKGMIVCMSRKICVHLYEEIKKIRPDWHSDDPKKGKIKVIMTGSASDPQEFQQHIYNSYVKKDLEKRVKDPNDELKLVIVRDMWLTGFDAPAMHTMYVDKPMKGHNLMQAIARINRVFKDKNAGLVVDYIGIARNLEKAVNTYTQSGGKGDVCVDIERAYEEFLSSLEVCQDYLNGFDYSAYKTHALKILPDAVDYILGKEHGKQGFADACLQATKAYALCKNKKEAYAYNEEIAFFQYIRSILIKKEGDNISKKASDEDVQSAIKAIISNAIITEGVIDIFATVGLDKPNISIISDEFLANIKNMPQKNLAAKLLEQLISGQIKTKFKTNIILEKKFSESLKDIITRYNNGTIETAQVIEELLQTAKDINVELKKGQELGLSDAEIAFYNALEQNEASVRELGDDILKKIAQELTEYLRNSTKVDWTKRESVRSAIKIQIKRILKKYKYPPDSQAEAINRVLEQAERVSEEKMV